MPELSKSASCLVKRLKSEEEIFLNKTRRSRLKFFLQALLNHYLIGKRPNCEILVMANSGIRHQLCLLQILGGPFLLYNGILPFNFSYF